MDWLKYKLEEYSNEKKLKKEKQAEAYNIKKEKEKTQREMLKTV